MPLFAFNKFLKSKFAFNECEFLPALSHHYIPTSTDSDWKLMHVIIIPLINIYKDA